MLSVLNQISQKAILQLAVKICRITVTKVQFAYQDRCANWVLGWHALQQRRHCNATKACWLHYSSFLALCLVFVVGKPQNWLAKFQKFESRTRPQGCTNYNHTLCQHLEIDVDLWKQVQKLSNFVPEPNLAHLIQAHLILCKAKALLGIKQFELNMSLCSRNFQNVKLRSSIREFICH